MKAVLSNLAAGLGLVLATTLANAAVIDFEESAVLVIAPSISSGGFTFAPASGNVFAIPDANVVSTCSPDCASNGTRWLGSVRPGFLPANTQPVTMTEGSGRNFMLLGLDASELFVDLVTTNLLIVGNLAGGGTISVNLSLDGVNDSQGGAVDFQSFVLPAVWGQSWLSSVEFNGFSATGAPGDASIDNLNVTVQVPEPGTLALLGLGLAGLAASRRRKQ